MDLDSVRKIVIQNCSAGDMRCGELLWISNEPLDPAKYRKFHRYPSCEIISVPTRTVFHTVSLLIGQLRAYTDKNKGMRLEQMYARKREHYLWQLLLYQNSNDVRNKFKSRRRPSESVIQASHPCSSTSELINNFGTFLMKVYHSNLNITCRLILYQSILLRYSSLNITGFLTFSRQ
jgi:hypothetical protein